MEKRDDFYLPEEILEWIGLKKSEYLSRLISFVDPSDYGFEVYHQFDSYISQTIEEADKLIEFKEDNYDLRTYIKTYSSDLFFHQIVIGAVIPDLESEQEVFVPILMFVTKKEELVKIFSAHHSKVGPILN
ncbi:MAG: hypothetical protein AB7I27_11590 [Bacteriovoracaceae bacterium]